MRAIITREAMTKICGISSDVYPNEFHAYLEGDFNDDSVTVRDIIFQPYAASEDAVMSFPDIPLTVKIVGSVHSHPGRSNTPSEQDLRTFSKQGLVHIIIRKPYSDHDAAFYDMHGRRIDYEIR